MTKVFVEICLLEPENTVDVVETLIRCGFAVVVRANAHDKGGPTIFLYGYGTSDIPHLRDNNRMKPLRRNFRGRR